MTALKLDPATVAAIDVPTLPADDVPPPHVTTFGSPTIGLVQIAGPADGPGLVAVWTCDKDGIEYASLPEAEAAFVTEGVLRVTSAEGGVTEAKAGEGYYLPVGWSGRIEAVEPVRKLYFLL